MIGFVCGLKSEAACAPRGAGALTGVSGAKAARAAEIARDLADEGATALISFGVSGALAPDLEPGALFLAAALKSADGEIELDWSWSEHLAARLARGGLEVARKSVYGSDVLISSIAEKRALRQTSGADAVDMESHAVARVACRRGLEFAALRAIADPHDGVLPAAAQNAVGADGGARILPVLYGLARRPADLGALIKLGRDSQRAHQSLMRAGEVLKGCA